MLTDQVDAMVYGHYVDRDDFKDGNGDRTYGAAGEVSNILAKVGYSLSDRHRFELSYDMYRDEGDYNPRPDMGGSANNGLTGDDLIPTEYDRDTVTVSYELSGDRHHGKLNIYRSETEIYRDESAISGRWPGNRHSENTAKNRNDGANATFQYESNLAGRFNQLTYGFDYMDKTTSSTYGGTPFMKESAETAAVFAEDRLQILEAVAVTAGLRYDNYKRKATNDNDTFDEVTWSLGTEWDVTQHWTLFANSRSLFKGPELLETFIAYQDVAFLAEDIKPETGLNNQIGARYLQHFGDHTFSGNLTLFKTDIDDYIGEFYQPDGTYLTENIGDVELKGFEFSVNYRYESLFTRASYARTDSENKTTGGPLVASNGRSADLGDSISFGIDYYFDSVDTAVGWTSLFVLEEDNVLEGQPEKPSYNTHDMYVQWQPRQLNDRLLVTFGIDNIFDEAYTSHASRSGLARGTTLDDLEPGRNYKLSASYQF